MTAQLLYDLITLVTALALMVRTAPELWLALGDVAYQLKHR